MPGISMVALVLWLAAVSGAFAQGAPRIETPEALSHIITKVEPAVPAEAAAAKAGGVVIADVTIGPAGTVSALTILSGAPMLHAAAERALRQWTFKPFVVNGRARTVQVILEVQFPDPARDEEKRAFDAFSASRYTCQRALEANPTQAEAPCAEAVRATEALPRDRVLERSYAAADHAHALFRAGRTQDAIVSFQRALTIRETVARGPDADSAAIHQVLGSLYVTVGEMAKADAEYATAIDLYDRVLPKQPASLRELYTPRLREALVSYSKLKQFQGNAKAVQELDARVAALGVVSELGARTFGPPNRSRTAGPLRIVEPPDAQLSASDLETITSVLRRAGRTPWLLEAAGVIKGGGSGIRSWAVYAYEKPEISSPAFRRGSVGQLSCAEAADAGCPDWTYAPAPSYYVQIPSANEDAASAPPIRIQPPPNSPAPSDADVIDLVRWVRDQAVHAETDRLLVDIQPWPVDFVSWGEQRAWVTLRDPAHADRRQSIDVRRTNGRWSVAAMR